MAMKIELPGGAMLHLDGSDDLAAALRVLREENLPPKKPSVIADESQRVRALFRNVNTNARKFLVALAAQKNGISGDEFVQASGIKAEAWGGTMGGIKKQAEAQSLTREMFVVSEMRSVGTQRVRFLTPGPLLIKYEIELHRKDQISMGA